MDNLRNLSKDFINKSVFTFDLETPEVMIVWSLRHWSDCIHSKEDPKDLFLLCTEQHGLPDVSVLFEEIIIAIDEGSNEKGAIGGEFCNHIHYGEFKILEALYSLQIDFQKINISKIDFFNKVKRKGVQLQVHYIPIHLQPFYKKKFGYKVNQFPNAEKFYKKEVSLPIYPDLKNNDLYKVINELLNIK